MGLESFERMVGKRSGENDRWRLVEARDMPGGLDAVHARHPNVHQHDVGLEALRQPEGFQPVDRFTHQFVLIETINHASQPVACRFLIVDYQYLHYASAPGILNFTV